MRFSASHQDPAARTASGLGDSSGHHAVQPPGRDTTAVAHQGDRRWIASRRGLRAAAP